MFEYTIAIRTLGKAGEKYRQTLESIKEQTVSPSAILIYIAEGYPTPEKTVNIERYIYVKKGMVAQRALSYSEINTEYILFLDDDVYLPPDAVEKMYCYLIAEKADVISPDVFPNANRSFLTRLKMAFVGKSIVRNNDNRWAYKALRNGGYSYNGNPHNDIYESQLNAGPCFLCRKKYFLDIHYEEELWLDVTPYALPEDQIMFYKMYKKGYKQLTLFNSGIEHLDAGTTNLTDVQKHLNIVYSESRNRLIFWHRFIYLPERKWWLKGWDICCISWAYLIRSVLMLLKLKKKDLRYWFKGIGDAIIFIKSSGYKTLPRI